MIKLPRLTLSTGLFILAFAVGIILRYLYLGSAPLSDFEAEKALGALFLSRGSSLAAVPDTGYMLLTSVLFNLFEGSNLYARFWVAFAGSTLILVPYLFRDLLGHTAAIILAFGLALDPGMVAISRLVGGPMIALSFGLLALGFLYQKKPILCGVFGGLALLGGPSILHGALIFLLTWFIGKLVLKDNFMGIFAPRSAYPEKAHALRNGLFAGGSVVLLAGTLIFWIPQGLSNFALTIPIYLNGWIVPSGVSIAQLLAALFIYQPLGVVFGVIGGVRSWMESKPLNKWMSLWIITSLVLVLIYPARQAYDLVWILIPLWVLAAIEISRFITIDKRDRIPAIGQAILIFLLLALAWINLSGLSQNSGDIQAYRLRWAVIFGTLALGAVTSVLVGLGWSSSAAVHGLVWGLIAGLGVYGLANTWWISQSRPNGELELWYPPPVTGQEAELVETLKWLSEAKTGIPNQVDIAVTATSPSLQWALRDWQNTRFFSGAISEELPLVIISDSEESAPALAGSYRGQDFAWRIFPGWQGALPIDWPRWLVFRNAPQQVEHIILWARSDIFPGGELFPIDEQAPSVQEELPEDSPLR